jgi:hypothetical protein
VTFIHRLRPHAHLALAAIRFVNGVAALFFPRALARRIGVDLEASPGLMYFQRMFGIRTILLAHDLVRGDQKTTERALRIGRVVHASDAASAAVAGLTGNVARRPAVMITVISLLNLLLAFAAKPPRSQPRWLKWLPR